MITFYQQLCVKNIFGSVHFLIKSGSFTKQRFYAGKFQSIDRGCLLLHGTSDIFRGPCTPILWIVFPIGLMRLITVCYFSHLWIHCQTPVTYNNQFWAHWLLYVLNQGCLKCRNAGMLRLVSEILPMMKSAKQCDVTVEICIS
jgi:hypothetical protein